MSIKVCNHEYSFHSLGMNMWEKTYVHPSVKMGNRIRNSTPAPPLYDVYTTQDLDPRLADLARIGQKNTDDIQDSTKKLLAEVKNLKSKIIEDKKFLKIVAMTLLESDEFKKILIEVANSKKDNK